MFLQLLPIFPSVFLETWILNTSEELSYFYDFGKEPNSFLRPREQRITLLQDSTGGSGISCLPRRGKSNGEWLHQAGWATEWRGRSSEPENHILGGGLLSF